MEKKGKRSKQKERKRQKQLQGFVFRALDASGVCLGTVIVAVVLCEKSVVCF